MNYQMEITSCDYGENIVPLSFSAYESSVLSENEINIVRPNIPKKIFMDFGDETFALATETAVTMHFSEEMEKTQLLIQIQNLIDIIISKEEIFKTIDRRKLLKEILKIINELSPDAVRCSDEELETRIRQIMVLEIVSGMLNDLSSEQIKTFDEAVKRRRLFK